MPSQELHICIVALSEVDMRSKLLTCDIVEIVIRSKEHLMIISAPEILNPCGSRIRVILARYMVWHKIYYNLHAGGMRTLHQRLEFLHAVRHIYGKVGVNVVIVADSIGTARMAFYHMRIVTRDAIGSVIGVVRVLYHARIPHMCGTKSPVCCRALAL